MNSAFKWETDTPLSLSINDKTIECCCYGPAPDSATTIVLLHEGLGCVALWRDFPARLSQHTGCGVFVYSREGYGSSDSVTLPRPLDYMTRHALEYLPAILDAINSKKVVLLGHSDGASIASVYAGSANDHRIRALILLAPHYFAEQESLSSIAEAKEAYLKAELRARLSVYHTNVDNAFYGWCDAWLHPDFAQWSIVDNLDYIRVPVLAMQGRQDQYGTLAQIEVIEERCYAPVELVVIEDCKHSPHLEQSEQVLKLAVSFVERINEHEANV